MNKSNLLKLFSLIILLNLTFIKMEAQDDQSMDSPEMKAFMEYIAPGEMHKFLEKFAGDWEITAQFWMTPDSPSENSKGTANNKMLMDGRYLQLDQVGKSESNEFHGMGVIGYDNAEKKFQSTWIDNFGTVIFYQKGDYNKTDKSIEFAGEFTDFMTGKPIKARTVYTYINDNHWTCDMYNIFEGKEFKSMHTDFIRKK